MMIRPPAYFQQLAAGSTPHVAGQDQIVDLILVAQFDQPVVVRHAVGIADRVPVDTKLFGHGAAVRTIAEHHGRLGPHLAVANRPQQRQRRLGPDRGADSQPRPLAPLVGRPDADR